MLFGMSAVITELVRGSAAMFVLFGMTVVIAVLFGVSAVCTVSVLCHQRSLVLWRYQFVVLDTPPWEFMLWKEYFQTNFSCTIILDNFGLKRGENEIHSSVNKQRRRKP